MKYFPDFRFDSNKVAPNEVDWRYRYTVTKPSVGTAAVGTLEAGTVAGTLTLLSTQNDYPRNLLYTVVGPSGGVGGTFAATGTNQFGVSKSETLTIASANAGGTAAGTQVFDTLSTITYFPNGVDNTSTVTVGYAIGTAAGLVGKLGFPVKIKATSDVKRLTWIKNGTYTPIQAGTIGTLVVDTTNHAFRGTAVMAATDEWVVEIKTTYDYENDTKTA